MGKIFNIGDRVKFNDGATKELIGNTGVVNKFLSVETINLCRLENGKPIFNGLHIDVNMWEILYPHPPQCRVYEYHNVHPGDSLDGADTGYLP